MNASARGHLAKAKEYADQGEQFYRMAAEQIVAAREADFHLSWEDVGDSMGKSEAWCREIVKWHTNPQSTTRGNDVSPWAEEKGAVAKRHAQSVLRNSTSEQVEELVASLPPDAVAKVAKAVSSHYEDRGLKAKQEANAAFRAEVGDDLADSLGAEQRLRDAEAKVFEARRALRDMLALLNDSDLESMRDSWREDFLKTLDDLAMRIDVARSLLGGTLDADLEQFLAEV